MSASHNTTKDAGGRLPFAQQRGAYAGLSEEQRFEAHRSQLKAIAAARHNKRRQKQFNQHLASSRNRSDQGSPTNSSSTISFSNNVQPLNPGEIAMAMEDEDAAPQVPWQSPNHLVGNVAPPFGASAVEGGDEMEGMMLPCGYGLTSLDVQRCGLDLNRADTQEALARLLEEVEAEQLQEEAVALGVIPSSAMQPSFVAGNTLHGMPLVVPTNLEPSEEEVSYWQYLAAGI